MLSLSLDFINADHSAVNRLACEEHFGASTPLTYSGMSGHEDVWSGTWCYVDHIITIILLMGMTKCRHGIKSSVGMALVLAKPYAFAGILPEYYYGEINVIACLVYVILPIAMYYLIKLVRYLTILFYSYSRHSVCIFAVAVYRWWHQNKLSVLSGDVDQYISSMLLKKLSRVNFQSEFFRSPFMDLPQTETRPAINHTHPVCAAERSAATDFIERYARLIGREPYFVQCSRADQRAGRLGSRTHYWAKDLNVDLMQYSPPQGALLALVDVDQYLDMPTFLCETDCPVIIYTFQPESVARSGKEFSYTFDANNQVRYDVNGGGCYTHKVWNYSRDNILVFKYDNGYPVASAAYLVDRRRTGPDHEIILLTPLGVWGEIATKIVTETIFGRQLRRLSVAVGPFLRLGVNSPGGMMISTGRVSSYCSATIPAMVDDTISTMARTGKYDLTMAQVLSFVEGDRSSAAALLEYHRSDIEGFSFPDMVCPVADSVRRYQFKPNNYDPEAKPSLQGFMSPLLHGAFAPDLTVDNEKQCIDGRVEKVKPPIIPMTPFLSRLMREFAELLVPKDQVHTLDPVDVEVVYDRQNRPSQRRILASSEGTLAKRVVKMFMKREAYQNIKDPRAISTINCVDKREYSQYIYAMETVLKQQPWYAFSKTPVEIAVAVSNICQKATHVINSDFSRFDGHGSNVMRELEKSILLRAFRPKYHQNVSELHRSQYGLKAYGTFGNTYNSEFTRASGSPETSLFNSLVNAFVAYSALRATTVNGVYMTSTEAYAALGIYGGDDGLTANIAANVYVTAAANIGQELVAEPIQRGKLGVKFLSRQYSPNVWFGCHDSVCDIPRQLSKFHTTVTLPNTISPLMKLSEKVRSYLLTDANTPIIGDFCRVASSFVLPQPTGTCDIASWFSHYDSKVQFPNEYGDWMMDYVWEALPDFDYKGFRTWLSGVRDVDQLLSCPMFQAPIAPKSAVPVVIDDIVIETKNKVVVDIKSNAPQVPPIARVRTADKKETFEEMKARKLAKGMWKDRSTTSAPRETFEQLKARKQKTGQWVERPPRSGVKGKPPSVKMKGA